MHKQRASKDLLELINKAIASELTDSIQYMWQYVMCRGLKGYAIKDELKKIAIESMKHAEEIAERIAYLGGVPTVQPDPIVIGSTLKEMLEKDLKDEEYSIILYKEIIKLAQKEGDETTKRLFRKILSDEEGHHNTVESLLEDL